jgi:hypothetical protein
MKKSKLQVIADFLSQVKKLKPEKERDKKSWLRSQKLSISMLLLLFAGTSGYATTYFSRASGNWNANSSWSTVNYGNATNTGTFPKTGDIANIGNGHTVYINASVNCATLNVGQGTSGTIEYLSPANYFMNITGNVTVNTGAKIWYNTAVNRTHTFLVGGNFTNYGTVDFYLSAGRVIDLQFRANTNSNVIGTGVWDLNNVTLNKSGAIINQLNVLSSTFESAIRNFVGTYGTFVHNNTTAYSINPASTTFTIGPNMVYKVPLGIMRFASAGDQLILQGALYVNGGTVFVGTTAGYEGIRTDRSGTTIPYLDVSSGVLIVYGGISFSSTSMSDPFSFAMSGGSVLLNAGTVGTARQVFCTNDVAGSLFTITGGTITLQKPNITGNTTIDFLVCGNNGTVTTTGGLVQFGNGVTAVGANFSFKPFSNATLPNFRISGQTGTANTLATSYASTSNFKLLSLYIETGKTFDIRSIGGTAGDTKTMTLLGAATGTDAIYNNGTFNARQSTVTFNTTGTQSIGGTTITTFYNLSVNNSSNITLNRPVNVSNYLSMVNGKLITTNTNLITLNSNANASLGTTSSYVDGPMVQTVATTSSITKTYPIGKGTSYRPIVLTVQHSSVASVTYRSEVFNSAASSLPYTYPPSISNVSHVRYTRFVRQNVNNFVSGSVQMYYNMDDVVADKNTLAVAQDNGGSMWMNVAGNATANWVGSITSSTFNVFNSFFTLANPPGGGNPLPIQMSSFSALLQNKKVNVNWTTQTEVNNDFFTVERSADNVAFTPIGTVDGSGNSSETRNYAFTDNQPLKGVSYYRISQTDYDGRVSRTNAVAVNNKVSLSFAIYPNPATSGRVKLRYEDMSTNMNISVQDITGRVIPCDKTLQDNGDIDLVIDERFTERGGIFIITATDGAQSYKQKLIVN